MESKMLVALCDRRTFPLSRKAAGVMLCRGSYMSRTLTIDNHIQAFEHVVVGEVNLPHILVAESCRNVSEVRRSERHTVSQVCTLDLILDGRI